jgi:AraC-like ligand binding domain
MPFTKATCPSRRCPVGDTVRYAEPGDILIVRAGEPHEFVNSGQGVLRQIDIHLNPTFETTWLEDEPDKVAGASLSRARRRSQVPLLFRALHHQDAVFLKNPVLLHQGIQCG